MNRAVKKRGREGAKNAQAGAFARLKKTARPEIEGVVNGFSSADAKECLIACEKARREGWRQKFVGDEEMNRMVVGKLTVIFGLLSYSLIRNAQDSGGCQPHSTSRSWKRGRCIY